MIHYVPLPGVQAIHWIIQSCFKELMKKGAMRSLKLHNWHDTCRISRQQDKAAGVSESSSTEKRERLSREQRSEKLAVGLLSLAQKCHVSLGLQNIEYVQS